MRSADIQHVGRGRSCCCQDCCCRLPARDRGCCSMKLPHVAAVDVALAAAAVVVVVVDAVVVVAVRCCLLEIADVQTLSQGDCQAKNLPISRILNVSAYHTH